MDGQRFDGLARALAEASTRWRGLRLAGGAVAGALLAAAGLRDRAGAQGRPVFTYCRADGGPRPGVRPGGHGARLRARRGETDEACLTRCTHAAI